MMESLLKKNRVVVWSVVLLLVGRSMHTCMRTRTSTLRRGPHNLDRLGANEYDDPNSNYETFSQHVHRKGKAGFQLRYIGGD